MWLKKRQYCLTRPEISGDASADRLCDPDYAVEYLGGYRDFALLGR
jgi:hypothetical protein